MSYYIKNTKDCGCGKDRDFAKCETFRPCPKNLSLECGTVGGMMMFDTTGQVFTAANLNVDTSCFKRPEIFLMFTSQVSATLDPTAGLESNASDVPEQNAEVVLLYELVCKRDGGSEFTIGSWTFRRSLTGGAIEAPAVDIVSVEAQDKVTSDTFNFGKCLNTLPGVVDYTVKVTATTVSQDTVTATNNASATVSMGQLVATIQEV